MVPEQLSCRYRGAGQAIFGMLRTEVSPIGEGREGSSLPMSASWTVKSIHVLNSGARSNVVMHRRPRGCTGEP